VAGQSNAKLALLFPNRGGHLLPDRHYRPSEIKPNHLCPKDIPCIAIANHAIVYPVAKLTLSRDTFHILVALADRDRHGYAIMQDIAERTGGQIQLSPSTLYSAIKRLLEAGLISELAERPDPAHDDERRRYYRITDEGRAAAMAEAGRLEKLLADARATGLVPER
jgi:DNA-binding PadR family transcriptional regulator